MYTRTLLIYKPDGSTEVFEIVKPVIKIGRAGGNDLVLDDSQRSISREQAQIVCADGAPPLLTDLKSANGTFLNEHPVTKATHLYPDDVIRIAQYRIIYRDPEAKFHPTEPDKPHPFQIQASPHALNELQARAGLLHLTDHADLPHDSREFRALDLLHEVGVQLARTVTIADVTETAVDLLFRIEGVQRSTLMLWDEQRQAFLNAPLFLRGARKMDHSQSLADYDPRNLVLSKTILQKVRSENRPLHIRDTRSADLAQAASIVRSGIQAAFCSPLTCYGRLLGVLYADNLVSAEAFTSADFRVFTSIAAQSGLALASALTRGELTKHQIEQAAMRLYLPPQVADLITSNDGSIELGGVLQPVTVLYADIRGFTRFSEEMDAREVVMLLNEFFTAMTQVIFESGGTLDKYIGDCVMALFGAPVPADDDLVRGLGAARNIQREVARMNASRRRRGLTEIQVGVGLHTGPAVVGNIGSAHRMQYTAIGDTVNVAARLVGKAAAGQVIVSQEVRSAAPSGVEFGYLGEVDLKGREKRLKIYSLSWEEREESL